MDQNNLSKRLWEKPTSRNFSSLRNNDPTFKPSLFSSMSKLSATSFASPSSFYSGKIQYGGAMSASRIIPSPYVIPKVKKRSTKNDLSDGNEKTNSGSLSSTARKILHTLEKMSTPLRDLKKIPPPSIKFPNIFGRQYRKRPLGASAFEGAGKKVCPPRSGRTYLTKTTNKTANIPLDNSLSTHSLVKNISQNENDSNAPVTSETVHKGIPGVLASFTSSAGMKLKSTKSVVSSGGGGGKMKNQRKMHAHYSAADKEDKVLDLDLPDVTFNIRNLPSFNFTQPDSTSTPAPPKPSMAISKNNLELEYTFAVPAKASPKVRRDNTSTSKLNFNSPVRACDLKQSSCVLPKTTQTQSNSQSSVSLSKNSSLKAGSVMDILKGNMGDKKTGPASKNSSKIPLSELFQKPSNKWECEVCMVHNDNDKSSCIACESPKPGQNPAQTKNDEGQNKISLAKHDNRKEVDSVHTTSANTKSSVTGSNSCAQSKTSSEFVSNVSRATNSSHQFSFGVVSSDGVAAKSLESLSGTEKKDFDHSETKQPFNTIQSDKKLGNSTACASPNLTRKDVTKTDTTSANKLQFQFGLKPNLGWTCDVCLVQNTKDCDKCVACENPNPAKKNLHDSLPAKNLTNQFQFGAKQNLGAWTCDVCLVSNSADRSLCAACENQRPGTKSHNSNAKISSSFKFGNTSSNVYKFGIETPEEKIKIAAGSTIEKSTAVVASTTQTTTVTSSLLSSGLKFVDSIISTKASTNPSDVEASSFAGKDTGTDEKKSVAGISSFAYGGTVASTFKFGAKSRSDDGNKVASESIQAVSKPFSFGTSAVPSSIPSSINQTVSSKHSFSFGGSATTIATPENQQQPPINLLSSVNTTINDIQPSKPSISVASNFGSQSTFGGSLSVSSTAQTTSTTLFSGFGQQAKQTVVVSSQNKPVSTFQFGSQSTAPAVTQPTMSTTKAMFSFGSNSTAATATNLSSSVTNAPMFGSNPATTHSQINTDKRKPATSAGLAFTAFNQQHMPSQDNAMGGVKSSTFSGFGQQNTQKNLVHAVPNAPFAGFGQSAANASQTKSTFSFGNSGTSVSTFGKDVSSIPKPQFSFGSNTAPSQTPFGNNAFGNSNVNTTATSQAPPFQFGSGQAASKQQTSVFGNAQANTKSAFGFGSASDNSKPAAEFKFGGAQANAGTAPSFKFGSSAADKNPTPSAGFNFDGSKNVFPSQPQAAFQFGGTSNQVDMQPKPDSTTNTGFQFNANPAPATSFGHNIASNARSGLFNIGQSGRATPTRAMKQAKRRLKK